jgi:hypothetical protein
LAQVRGQDLEEAISLNLVDLFDSDAT